MVSGIGGAGAQCPNKYACFFYCNVFLKLELTAFVRRELEIGDFGAKFRKSFLKGEIDFTRARKIEGRKNIA